MSVGAVNKQTGERIPTAGMPAVDSVLSGSSTNPVQNRVVKEALDDKQDALTFDDTPTDGSNNPVKSNGIYDSEKDIYAAMGEMGAKNLIPYPYYESDHTESGITWTVNSDGSITANGTATANSTFILRYRTEQTKFVEKNTSYILSGCPSGGSNSTYSMAFFVKNQDDSNIANGADFGDGITINMPNKDYYGIYAFARVFSGQTVSNLTFKPMLRLASDTDDTYQPYAKTNKQLTDDVALLDSEKADTDMVAADFNAGTSYTAGNYCIYEGKFYKFKNNHSGAWAAADVDEIKIAGELSSLKSGLVNKSNQWHKNLTLDKSGTATLNDFAMTQFTAYILLITPAYNPLWRYAGIVWRVSDPANTTIYDIFKGSEITVSIVDGNITITNVNMDNSTALNIVIIW